MRRATHAQWQCAGLESAQVRRHVDAWRRWVRQTPLLDEAAELHMRALRDVPMSAEYSARAPTPAPGPCYGPLIAAATLPLTLTH